MEEHLPGLKNQASGRTIGIINNDYKVNAGVAKWKVILLYYHCLNDFRYNQIMSSPLPISAIDTFTQ